MGEDIGCALCDRKAAELLTDDECYGCRLDRLVEAGNDLLSSACPDGSGFIQVQSGVWDDFLVALRAAAEVRG